MDETEFLRGIEGEKQQGEDLVAGAEHLVRLKIQSGQDTKPSYPDLELEKKADLSESIGSAAMCKGCGKVKTGCMCGKGKYAGAADGLKDLLGKAREGLKANPGARAAVIGGLAGGGANAVLGAVKAPPGHRLEGAAKSGIQGAAVGAGGNYLMHHLQNKLASVQKEKTAASLKELLKAKFSNPSWGGSMLAATTGLGAAAGGIGTYLASRPQEDTGKSKAEEELGTMVDAQKGRPERGLLQKMKNRETENAHGFAKAFREHPAKASLLGAITGGIGGYGIGRLGGAIARRGGK